MSAPSPFDVSRAIGANTAGAFREVRDENAIERILSQASQSGNPRALQDSMSKILSQVSPERQGPAMQYLQNLTANIQQKQEKARAEAQGRTAAKEAGYTYGAPPQVQGQQVKDKAKTGRLAQYGLGGGQPQGQISSIDGASVASNPNQPMLPTQSPFKNLTDDQLVIASGAPDREISEPAKEELKNRQVEKTLKKKEEVTKDKAIDKSYELQKDFIDDTTSQYKGFETEMKPRLLQMQRIPDNEIVGPTAAKFLEALGIPLGALDNPSSELYNKLSQDLLKGLPETYGSRILKVEVDNFLKTIPTLLNSPDGRRMIASNMLKLGQMKEVFYKEMRRQQVDLLDQNTKFPKDFQQRVFDNVKPQMDRLNNQFVKLSEVKSVPKDTIPFFDPQGNISFVPNTPEAIEWAEKNNGERIW